MTYKLNNRNIFLYFQTENIQYLLNIFKIFFKPLSYKRALSNKPRLECLKAISPQGVTRELTGNFLLHACSDSYLLKLLKKLSSPLNMSASRPELGRPPSFLQIYNVTMETSNLNRN